MSVDQRKVIDAIGIERESGDVNLTISDHLDWSNALNHIYTLQVKINDYLLFLESGEIDEFYPKAKGKRKKIQIHFKHAVPEGEPSRFIQHACEVVEKAGFSLHHKNCENEA